MKSSKKFGLIFFTTLIITAVLVPNVMAVDTTITDSTVGVSVGDSFTYVYSNVNQTLMGDNLNNGDLQNFTITDIRRYGGFMNVYDDLGGQYINGTKFLAIINSTMLIWNATIPISNVYPSADFGPGVMSVMPYYYLLPKPLNVTKFALILNVSTMELLPAFVISSTQLNITMAPGIILRNTYNTNGILTRSEYFSGNQLGFVFSTYSPSRSEIPFSDFYLGITVVAIIGLVVVIVKKRKFHVRL